VGFFSRIVTLIHVLRSAGKWPARSRMGPTSPNTMTKRMLAMEWAMSVEEAIRG
jgi:hypothetical protein